MLFLDHTCASTEENLALDEALLMERESSSAGQEVLRLWDARQPFIVLGRSSKVEVEVDRAGAVESNIPILRRSSGGASIMAAHGCLFYAVLLSLSKRPQLRMLDAAHRFVMSRLLEAVRQLRPEAGMDGTCDLVLHTKKVSGNSMRVQREWLLYHGTLLLDMDLHLLAHFLKHPPREPSYRYGRIHADFVGNLNVDRESLAASLRRSWRAETDFGALLESTRGIVSKLVAEKYTQPSWNFQR